jgi:hypothetical protein
MACIKTLFFLTLLLSLTTGHSQTIDESIENTSDLDANAQYQLGMLFYGVSVEQDKHPEAERLKNYFNNKYVSDQYRSRTPDSLDIEYYKEWLFSHYKENIYQSAKKGHDKGQLQLGKYYDTSNEYGSKIRAYKWYASSAAQGNTEAINWINQKNEELYLKQYLKPEDYKNIDFYEALLDLSNSLCNYSLYNDPAGNTWHKHIETELLQFLKITKEDADYKTKLIDFWNSYNKFFICVRDRYDDEHILKYALTKYSNQTDFVIFNWLFDLNQTKTIDFNQVLYYDGQPETILDFLNIVLLDRYHQQRFDIYAIRDLTLKLIVHYGAKTASQLKN